ncbi:MAG: type III restriction endonuclease subunit R, partial [Cetobacterium sp.]
MNESSKSPYDHVVYDSEVENSFAKGLEENLNVVVYAKLPDWFKITTPLGNYNPDWAILVKAKLHEEKTKLYFVVETKGSLFEDDLRETEKLKIQCGKEHFKV